MEENQSAKNIRIAKNTFFLYLRMFLMMGIFLLDKLIHIHLQHLFMKRMYMVMIFILKFFSHQGVY